jgi:tetratricopeptide (TPR) repeat protein
MAKQTVISRAELEGNNEELDFAEVALFWVRQHSSKILTVVSILFIVYAAVAVMRSRKEAHLGEGSNKLYSAYQDFDKGLDSPWASSERVTALESARAKADEILRDYKGQPLASTALLLKGNTYFFQGDQYGSAQNTQESIRYFTQFDEAAIKGGDVLEMAAAQLALGYAQENLALLTSDNPTASLAALNAALAHYEKVETTIGQKAGFLYYEALISKARLLATNRERDKAIDLYKKVYTERRHVVPEPEGASQRARMLTTLQQYANQFTQGATARLQLQRLGVDVDALDKELDAKAAPAPEAKK